MSVWKTSVSSVLLFRPATNVFVGLGARRVTVVDLHTACSKTHVCYRIHIRLENFTIEHVVQQRVLRDMHVLLLHLDLAAKQLQHAVDHFVHVDLFERLLYRRTPRPIHEAAGNKRLRRPSA